MAQSSGGSEAMQQARKVGMWIAVVVGILTILGTLITGVSGIAGKLLPSSYKDDHAAQHTAEKAVATEEAKAVTNSLGRIEESLKVNGAKVDSVVASVHALDIQQATVAKEVEGMRRELTQIEERRGGYPRPASPPD